jgi:dTDP-4-dehydrorhamnose 3,5-epimerase
MNFTRTTVCMSFVIDLERRSDQRGFFARTWCQKEFQAQGLSARVVQMSMSYNARKGTLRGMHYQLHPHEETRIVSCTRGAIYDVVLDLRCDSPTYLQWAAAELTAENHRMLYIPEGCAHGFQTLADDAEVLYLMNEFYSPEHQRGVRYNDPAFNIQWPLAVGVISPADRTWPDYQRSAREAPLGKLSHDRS